MQKNRKSLFDKLFYAVGIQAPGCPREGKYALLPNTFRSFFGPKAAGALLFVIALTYFFGFTPIERLYTKLMALAGGTETISLYAHECHSEARAEDFGSGWWQESAALGSPDVSPAGGLEDFSYENSAFYSGGNFGLICGGFAPLVQPEPAYSQETAEQALSNGEIETSSPDQGTAKSELSDVEEPSSSDQPQEPTDTTDDQIFPIGSETVVGDIGGEAIPDSSKGSETDGQSLPEVSADQSIEPSEPTVNVIELVPADTEILIEDMDNSSPAVETEMPAGPVSFLKSLLSRFEVPIVFAQGIITGHVASLDQLGTLRNAQIKLSLAMFDLERYAPPMPALDLEDAPAPAEDPFESGPEAEAAAAVNNTLDDGGDASSENTDLSDDFEPEVIELPAVPAENETNTEEIVEPETPATDPAELSRSWLDRFVPGAAAQETAIERIVVWYGFSSGDDAGVDTENTDNILWQKLDTLRGNELSNESNNGYLAYPAGFLKTWDDIGNLRLKLEGISKEGTAFTAYLDSVWVEAEYDPFSELEMIKKRQRWEEALKLVSSRLVFRANEAGELTFSYAKNTSGLLNGLTELLGLSDPDFWRDVEIEAELIGRDGEVAGVPLDMILEEDGTITVKLPDPDARFKPGSYKIRFLITDRSGGEAEELVIEQDFDWGVLAINTNKSIYTPFESAYLQMAVLDEGGHTICNADLDLVITGPQGSVARLSTADGSIVRNELCGPNNVIDTPDYYADYDVAGQGFYEMALTASTSNGIKTVTDRFETRETVPFEIERSGPTRIYPWADYDMKIRIKANEDFRGDIVEEAPSEFSIFNFQFSNNFQLSISDISEEAAGLDKKIVLKDVDFFKDEFYEFSYTFDAPNVSPEFYLLGPLELISASSGSVFAESRQWQIASDATSTSRGTNGMNVNWLTPGSAWDGNVYSYASRAIPKKSVVDSANYLEMTDSNAADMGGDITMVEIGVDGYVQDTAVTTYLVPRFNGATSGNINTITGATMGTTNDGNPTYFNITSDPSGPGAANWTWSDVINLNIRTYGSNGSNSTNYYLYIGEFWIRVTYTPNSAPTSTIVYATGRIDTSGVVDISANFNDANRDQLKAKLEYEAGVGCAFSSSDLATLDETDANATSTQDDAKIDNNQPFQIGSTTGWIVTTAGENTVNFDWLSRSDLPDTDGTYCLRLTANDGYLSQATPATTTVVIDNKAPTAPGALTATGTTISTITLAFGATTTDSHFAEYRIYYSDSEPVTESDSLLSSTTDPNLGDVLYNGEATTTVSGLNENTTYYFSVWAYDSYGNVASSTVLIAKTNSAPTAVFTAASPAAQRTDGSGVVDIAIDVFDKDNHESRAKLEVIEGLDCVLSPADPTLDETQANIQATYGVPKIANAEVYQIGTPDGYILTNATNTVRFDWFSAADLSEIENDYCLRLTANDQRDDQNVLATTSVRIDNKAPSNPDALAAASVGTSTAVLDFGTAAVDGNFSRYRVYYKKGTTGVTEGQNGESEHNDPNLLDADYNFAVSTLIENLDPDTDYVFKIWAYDQYGHKAGSAETTFRTDASVTNNSLVFLDPAAGNIAIGDGASEWTFRAVVADEYGWNYLTSVKLRLADNSDNASPFTDLEFTWTELTDSFSETGSDVLGVATLSGNSSSTCSNLSCTLDFKLIFDSSFASRSVNYAAELLSANDSAATDEDVYADFYQVKSTIISQIHYRWRNDNGGE